MPLLPFARLARKPLLRCAVLSTILIASSAAPLSAQTLIEHGDDLVLGLPNVRSAAAFGISDAVISLHPRPTLERLPINESALGLRDWWQVVGAAQVFDQPNGTLLRADPDGTHFVTVQAWSADGWAEISEGEWVRGAQLVRPPQAWLSGARLDDIAEQPYPVGWTTAITRPSRTPGAESVASDSAVMPYQFIYVYAEAQAGGQTWAQIGADQWIVREAVSVVQPVARPNEADSHRWIGVDLAENVLIAYEDDVPVLAALVATGVEAAPTDEGVFHIYARFLQSTMTQEAGQPWYYYIEDVPYTFYFNGHEAIHGAYWHNEFGTYRSHGCINLTMTDATWLYAWLSEGFDFLDADAPRPAVVVYRGEG